MQQLIENNSVTDAKQHSDSSSRAKVTHVILCVFCAHKHANARRYARAKPSVVILLNLIYEKWQEHECF